MHIRSLVSLAVALAALLLLAPAASASAATPKRCGSVFFTPQSDDLAAAIRAEGVTCRFARRFVRDSEGRPGATFRRYTCTSRLVDRPDSLSYTRYRCAKGARTIRWKRY